MPWIPAGNPQILNKFWMCVQEFWTPIHVLKSERQDYSPIAQTQKWGLGWDVAKTTPRQTAKPGPQTPANWNRRNKTICYEPNFANANNAITMMAEATYWQWSENKPNTFKNKGRHIYNGGGTAAKLTCAPQTNWHKCQRLRTGDNNVTFYNKGPKYIHTKYRIGALQNLTCAPKQWWDFP